MTKPMHHTKDDDAAALKVAVAAARAGRRFVPHDDMRAWLLRIADGDFSAAPPELSN